MCFSRSIVQGHGLLTQGLTFLEMADSAGPVLSDTTSISTRSSLLESIAGVIVAPGVVPGIAKIQQPSRIRNMFFIFLYQLKGNLTSGTSEMQQSICQFMRIRMSLESLTLSRMLPAWLHSIVTTTGCL